MNAEIWNFIFDQILFVKGSYIHEQAIVKSEVQDQTQKPSDN